jgi:hypothetical protein
VDRVEFEHKPELRGTNVLKYIEVVESQGLNKRPTCASRQRWYSLGEREPAELLFPERFWDRFVVFKNPQGVLENKDLYGVCPCDKDNSTLICALLNSTLSTMFFELHGRPSLGQGVLDIDVWMVGGILLPNPKGVRKEWREKLTKCLNELSQRPINSIFEEVGAKSSEEVSLDKVKPDRRELDKIIMSEILSLTEEEQLEVYRAVIDLVKSRIERAKSVQKRKKVEELDIDELVNSVLRDVERLHGIQAKRFPEDYIGVCPYRVVEVPREFKVEAGVDLEGPYVQIDDEKIKCNSIYEAKFIEYAVQAGKTRITIPTDEDVLKKAVEERTKLLKDARARLEEFFNETIADRKLREKVRFEAFRRLGI